MCKSAVTYTATATTTEITAAANTNIATNKSNDKTKKTKTKTKKTKKTKDKTTSTTSAVAAATSTSSASNGGSVCASAGNLGGIAPPPVMEDTSSARPFSVDGSTFLNLSAACGRACDVQHKCVPPGDVGVIVVYARMQRTLADRTLLSGIVILRILLVKPQILKKRLFVRQEEFIGIKACYPN